VATTPVDLPAALSALRVRWGDAAPRTAPEIAGALALEALPDVGDRLEPAFRTGFAALDAVLGPGGVPRSGSVALSGAGSTGVTTLALRLAAEAQAGGAIVGWVDVARSFDPIEAISRGIRPDWLAVLVPDTLDEGLAMAADLLVSRTVDLLVLDLSASRQSGRARIGAQVDRLTALARRATALLVVIEPPSSAGAPGPIGESAHLRLELSRRAWVRLGRDVVGMETEAVIARNRRGPPGRRAGLRILYAEGGDRDACLLRDLLLDGMAIDEATRPGDATPPPLLAPPPAPAGAGTMGSGDLVPIRTGGARGPAVDGRDRRRREPRRARPRRAAGDAARERPSARSRSDLPRSPA
jgi:RecA/RadA recombinase